MLRAPSLLLAILRLYDRLRGHDNFRGEFPVVGTIGKCP